MPHKDPEARRAWLRKWRKANPDKRLAQQRRRCKKSPEKIRTAKNDYYARNKEKWRGYDLKFQYGITLAEMRAIQATQGNKCATCAVPFGTEWANKPHVDHDHTTGKVRGLLCSPCNMALGQMNENPAALRAMADYVERHRIDIAQLEAA